MQGGEEADEDAQGEGYEGREEGGGRSACNCLQQPGGIEDFLPPLGAVYIAVRSYLYCSGISNIYIFNPQLY